MAILTISRQFGSGGREIGQAVVPYVERHYRVLTERPNRAIAGLSMGGSQTLDIAFRHLAKFA